MSEILSNPALLAIAFAIGLVAGVVKGAIGFALPTILVSGLSTFISPHAALAGVVVPALVTNVWQALRQGPRPALQSALKFRRVLAVGTLVLLASAQLVPLFSETGLLLIVSVPIILFSAIQLLGWRPAIAPSDTWAAYLAGVVFGLFSGLAALFAPALVFYLTAINTEKTEQMRVQGVVFSVAAGLFGAAHLFSGVLTPASFIFSTVLLVPCLVGMWIGFRLHDALDQKTFRMLTLIVLLVSGLNLLRMGLMG